MAHPSWCHCHSLSPASVKFKICFTFLVPAHLDSPGKRAIKQVCLSVFLMKPWGHLHLDFCVTILITTIVIFRPTGTKPQASRIENWSKKCTQLQWLFRNDHNFWKETEFPLWGAMEMPLSNYWHHTTTWIRIQTAGVAFGQHRVLVVLEVLMAAVHSIWL